MMESTSKDGGLTEAVILLLAVDRFPRTGEVLRADPRLCTDAALTALDRLGTELAGKPDAPSPHLVAQLRAFLQRCSAGPLDEVFPLGDDTIDPQVVMRIRPDLDEADAAVAAYVREPDVALLDRSCLAWHRVLAEPMLTAAYPGLRAALLNDAGGVVLRRFWHAGRPDDLVTASELFAAALALTPPISARRIGRLTNLAVVRREQHLRHGDGDALADAETLLREAVRLLDLAGGVLPVAVDVLANLANVLRDRFLLVGEPDVLREAIDTAERACAVSATAAARVVLGDLLASRGSRAGDLADLDRAVSLLRGALDDIPEASPERPRTLVDLGIALTERHAVNGGPGDLDAAVELMARARDRLPDGAPDGPSADVQLAVALYRRFEVAGRLDDLDRAVDLLDNVLAGAPASEVAAAGWRVNLATVLIQRSRRTGRAADLDRAIDLYRSAVDAPELGGERFAVLNNLGNALRDRSRRVPSRDDLDLAVTYLERALHLCANGSVRQATTLANLGVALRDRFHLTGSAPDLDRALALTRRSVAIDTRDDDDRSRRWLALALAAQETADRGSAPAVSEAVDAYRRGCLDGLVGDPESALVGAQDWGGWATRRQDWAVAAEAYGLAVDAMDVLLRLQAQRHHQETWLRMAHHLAGRAAFAMVRDGRRRDAVRALERTRAATQADALGGRLDLARLGEARPDLADRYTRASDVLAVARARTAVRAP